MHSLIFVLIFILISSWSCSQKKDNPDSYNSTVVEQLNFPEADNFEKFWKDFQKMIINKDTSAFDKLIAFPLEGSDFIVKRYDGEGLNKKELIENYDRLFRGFVVKSISESTTSDLVFDVSTNTYRLHISNSDETGEVIESFMFYFRKEGKLSRIDYAG